MGSRRWQMRSTSPWTKAEAAASWWDGVARKHCSPSHDRPRQRPEAPGFSRVPRRLAGRMVVGGSPCQRLRKSPDLLNTEADLACLQSGKKGVVEPWGLVLWPFQQCLEMVVVAAFSEGSYHFPALLTGSELLHLVSVEAKSLFSSRLIKQPSTERASEEISIATQVRASEVEEADIKAMFCLSQ